MGMTITIRVERTELDPQGLKELLAMLCEQAGYGVRVVDVREDLRGTSPTASRSPLPRGEGYTEKQESLFGKE